MVFFFFFTIDSNCRYNHWHHIINDRWMSWEVLRCLRTYSQTLSSPNWITLWMNFVLLVRMVNSQVDPVIRDAFIVKLVVSFWARSFEIVEDILCRFAWEGLGIHFYFKLWVSLLVYTRHLPLNSLSQFLIWDLIREQKHIMCHLSCILWLYFVLFRSN